MNPLEKREAAAWTARWCRLAELHLEQLEALEADERMSQLSDVGALGLGLFTALHKVRTGAAAVLGRSHRAVQAYDADYPHIRDARNLLEHFDEYLKGTGQMQKHAGHRKQLSQVKVSMDGIFGENAQHRLSFRMVSKGEPDLGPYDLDTRAVVQAARQLRDAAMGVATDEQVATRLYRSPV